MASTITFRPRPGIADALAARCAANGGDRSKHINAALASYLGVEDDEPVPDDTQAGTDERQAVRRGEPPRGATAPVPARQAVPGPPGDAPPCPHPKKAEKKLAYGVQCTECGTMIR
jgi:hypothetical protein